MNAIVVNGAGGRMGRLVGTSLRRAGFRDVAGCDPAVEPPLRLADGELPLVDDAVEALEPHGVLVDFSHPDASDTLVRAAQARSARLVVGTTGHSEVQRAALRQAAEKVPVVLSQNFSLGINRLVQVLPALGVLVQQGFDVELMEAHHRGKRDAPSGTTALLLEALLGNDPSNRRVHGRFGTETRREAGEVGVHSLRAGQIPGEHTLLLAGASEVVEIRHRALDRSAFVSGVAPAVHFVRNHGPGLYSMLDVMADAPQSVV
ncbi:MAG: 4-hydroxy-tetrahydrodipicolinate reductase [Candidatus Latescibacterota bacterium]|nr:MAG: 4-hydroxy-tetrahydrodipicolinate reductase [Candidatus Latescibacterota bacterium]